MILITVQNKGQSTNYIMGRRRKKAGIFPVSWKSENVVLLLPVWIFHDALLETFKTQNSSQRNKLDSLWSSDEDSEL